MSICFIIIFIFFIFFIIKKSILIILNNLIFDNFQSHNKYYNILFPKLKNRNFYIILNVLSS
jgi:hypothetical protein